ncbi:MAG: TRAP transporter small permease [Bacteroidota bacterium]
MLEFLDRFEEYTCAAMLLFMALLAFVNVVVRYLTTMSFAFSEELLVNLFVWITMLGAAIGMRKGAHLSMTMVANALPKRYQKVIAAVSLVCSGGLFALLLAHGMNLVLSEYRSQMTTYSMGLPMWWFGLAVPVGSALMIIRVVQAGLGEMRALGRLGDDGRAKGAGKP